MGILRRLADRFDQPAETRTIDVSDFYRSPPVTLAGQRPVSARLAENLSTCLACVNAVASALATLPVYVYRRTDAGRQIVEDHPLMALVHGGPNEFQCWPDFVEFMAASVLLRGNALAEIESDSAGRVTTLRPVPWEWATVAMLPNGRLRYDVSSVEGLYGGNGRMRRLGQDDVIHVRDRSDDGIVGRSRLQRAAAVVSAGVSLQEFTTSLYANGINPSGALQADGKIGPDALANLQERFREAFSGSHNAARALILDQGLKWQQISVSPEDAEVLASRRFSGEELARLFAVPPPLIGDLSHGTFTNSETLIRFFAQSTLASWCRKFEATFSRALLSETDRRTHEIEFDLTGLLRGDPAQRWAAHKIAVDARVLTPNEVREVEGWNRRDGGDEFPALAAAPVVDGRQV